MGCDASRYREIILSIVDCPSVKVLRDRDAGNPSQAFVRLCNSHVLVGGYTGAKLGAAAEGAAMKPAVQSMNNKAKNEAYRVPKSNRRTGVNKTANCHTE